MNCKVSIIIPVYNAKKYLHRCLDSIITQTLCDIEIICINDGSDDDSLNVLREYSSKDSRLKILNYTVNRGQSFARNRGIEIANGEYVLFLDADDMIIQGTLHELYECATNQMLDIIIFGRRQIYELYESTTRIIDKNHTSNIALLDSVKTREKDTDLTKYHNKIYCGMDLFCLQRENGDYDVSICKKFWSKNFLHINNIKFKEGIIHEDFLFDFQGMMYAKRVKCLSQEYYIYYRHLHSTTLSKQAEKRFSSYFILYNEMLLLFRKLIDTLETNQMDFIYNYIKEIYALMKKEYLQIKDHTNIAFDSVWYQFRYKIFLVEQGITGVYCRPIQPHEVSILRKSNKTIIYGAGVVGAEVASQIHTIGIKDIYFAVTKKNTYMEDAMVGCRIYELEYFRSWNKGIPVILAVSDKFKSDMLKNLKLLGFYNIIDLTKTQ